MTHDTQLDTQHNTTQHTDTTQHNTIQHTDSTYIDLRRINYADYNTQLDASEH